MKTRALQLFGDEYLETCKEMTPTQIAKLLDDFRKSNAPHSSNTKLISIKVPENLLEVFKARSKENGVKYQTQIKELMKNCIIDLE